MRKKIIRRTGDAKVGVLANEGFVIPYEQLKGSAGNYINDQTLSDLTKNGTVTFKIGGFLYGDAKRTIDREVLLYVTFDKPNADSNKVIVTYEFNKLNDFKKEVEYDYLQDAKLGVIKYLNNSKKLMDEMNVEISAELDTNKYKLTIGNAEKMSENMQSGSYSNKKAAENVTKKICTIIKRKADETNSIKGISNLGIFRSELLQLTFNIKNLKRQGTKTYVIIAITDGIEDYEIKVKAGNINGLQDELKIQIESFLNKYNGQVQDCDFKDSNNVNMSKVAFAYEEDGYFGKYYKVSPSKNDRNTFVLEPEDRLGSRMKISKQELLDYYLLFDKNNVLIHEANTKPGYYEDEIETIAITNQLTGDSKRSKKVKDAVMVNGVEAVKAVDYTFGEIYEYNILPSFESDKLITLESISSGERLRVPKGELLEFYDLYDENGKCIHYASAFYEDDEQPIDEHKDDEINLDEIESVELDDSFEFNYDFVRPRLNDLLALNITKYMSMDQYNSIVDILELDSFDDEAQLRAIRNAVVDLLDKEAENYERFSEEWDRCRTTTSAVTYVIDNFIY